MSRLSVADTEPSKAVDTPFESALASERLASLLVEVARSINRDLAPMLPSRLDGDPRLDALRSLLLEHDRAALAAVQRKLDDPQQFAEAISAVLARAFTLAETREELAGVLAPVERAARMAIRKDPSTLVGVIHPLVGPAIRRSIAEALDGTLQGLNQAFKHSLSWRGLKWRLEAYRSGSTFGDVVLKHTVVFRVEHLFLIHGKTGLLLEHVAASEAETQDPHMVSGMLTAIQDFVRDSFGNNTGEAGGSIDSVRLGDLLLWCEAGPFAFLAAVIRGNPPETLRAVLRDTLTGIHDELRGPLEEFQGDSAHLGDLVTRLKASLQQQEQRPEKRLSPWLWALPLVLLVIAGSWLVLRKVEESRVAAYVQRLRHVPGVVVTGVERGNGGWEISGLRDPLATDPADLVAESNLDPARIVGHWEPYLALNPAIVLKRVTASLDPPVGVSLLLDGDTIRAKGSAPDHWLDKARVLIAGLPAGSPPIDLSGLKDVQDPAFVRLREAIQAHVVSFDTGAPRPAPGEEANLDVLAAEFTELTRVAKGLGFSVRVMIVGHTDDTGRETANLALSAARAEVVRSMLRARGIAPHLLLVRSAGTLEPEQGGPLDQEQAANRRVTFSVSTGE
jgi:outer membrane protein OmpA-like peptidoglycan-associated protein